MESQRSNELGRKGPRTKARSECCRAEGRLSFLDSNSDWRSYYSGSELEENCMPSSPRHRPDPLLYLTSICVVTVVFALLPMHTQIVSAASNTITVNSTSDVENSNDGLCTLREAITAANSTTSVSR